MNDPDIERFEAELGKLKPAPPPEPFMSRLNAPAPAPPIRPRTTAGRRPTRVRLGGVWRWTLRWLAPATLLAAAAGLVLTGRLGHPSHPLAGPAVLSAGTAAQGNRGPDDIVIDHRVVAAYDAVALLPGGHPVRFHCREWVDEIVFRDTARGLEFERSTPRLEVVPVRFETD